MAVVFSSGAEMRHAMGVAVFSGMPGVIFGLFLTPVFYVLIRAVEKRITGTDRIHTRAAAPIDAETDRAAAARFADRSTTVHR